MLDCYFKKNLGVDCPGCGAQRSFFELLKGNIIESFILFPALLPLLFTVIFLLFHLKYKFRNGARILVISFSLSALLMAINFLIKLI